VGLGRTRESLERLHDDAHPLVRLIAAHALLRAESRGAHARADHPDLDPALDLQHSVTRADTSAPTFERWA
jgi:L-aspartate oxidase